MGPEAANQKRKRGRPAAASRDDQSGSQRQLTLTKSGMLAETAGETSAAEIDEDPRPKKRGRPAKTEPGARPAPELLPEPEDAGVRKANTPPKRKRGRPRGIGNEKERHDEDPAVPKPAPRKRGRPSLSQESAQPIKSKPATAASTTTATAEGPSPRRRGRPPKKDPKSVGTEKDGADAEADEEADDENEAQASKPRSGRPGKARSSPLVPSQASTKSAGTQKHTKHTAEPGEGENAGPARKGRNHRDIASSSGDAQTQNDPAASEISRRRKAMKVGRSALENASVPEGTSASSPKNTPTTLPKSKKRGRPSAEETPAQEAAVMSSEKQAKRGRSSVTQNNGPTGDVPKPRGRKPKEQPPEEDDAQDEAEEPRRQGKNKAKSSQSKKGARPLRSQPEDRAPSPDEAAPPPFRQLTSRTRHVPREVIDAKWSPLEPASISSVAELLHSVSRPVLLRLTNLDRHTEATAALKAVSKRLCSKLSRGLPFPPATTAAKREDELQFERAVDGVFSLEAQLDPLLHGVALLKKEKERAQRELEREYKALHSLGANARAVGKERRDQLRKMHVLVPHPNREKENKAENLRQAEPAEKPRGKTFVGLENDELRSLAGQIGSHMESLRGNLQQIEGVAPAIAESRAALKLALMPHLDPSSYEKVLLG